MRRSLGRAIAGVSHLLHGGPVRTATALACTAAFAATVSCGGRPAAEPALGPPGPVKSAAPPQMPAPKGPSLLPAQVLAQVDSDKAVPYFARAAAGGGGIVLFSSKGHLMTRAVTEAGAPKGPAPIEAASLAGEPAMVSVKGTRDGYIAAWVEPAQKNRALRVLALDGDGKPREQPALILQAAEDISWIDVLPNAEGALVMWSIPREDRWDLYAMTAPSGKVEGAPQLVVRDVIGWEAEATARGAGLALVSTETQEAPRGKKRAIRAVDPGQGPKGSGLGRVGFLELDTKGRASAKVAVTSEATAQFDVTVAEVAGRFVLAWTDERSIDACVYLAVVEPGGKVVSAPHPATPPFGEQALVGLVAEPYTPGGPHSKRALLAWEDQINVQRDGRLVHLATVGESGTLGRERAAMTFSASGAPDIVADGDGFTAMTLSPVRVIPEGLELHTPQGAKAEAPVWPAYVRFRADLSVIASEPVRAEPFATNDGAPYLTTGLSCTAGTCTTIATGAVIAGKEADAPGTAAPIALVTLPTRQSPWKAPAQRDLDDSLPRPSSVAAVYEGEHLSKLASAEVPTAGTLVAWVTYVLEAAGGKEKRKHDEDGATLSVRPLGATGVPGKTVTISQKAISVGGVALAPAPAEGDKKPETALAWVAREHGEPQVFVTKLGPNGEKLAQKGVTVVSRKRKQAPMSDASDVAVAYAGGGANGDGWITAWVDTRDGNAEIYVAKIDRSLTKVVPDRRITDAPGGAAEVQIAVRGKDVFLVWSDARENPDEGAGDIYVARLDAMTLKKAGPETRLFASAGHSRTPTILPTANGFLVSWIEEPTDPKSGAAPTVDAGLRLAELDDKGTLIGAPQLVRGNEGRSGVTSAALSCGAKICRGVLTSDTGGGLTLGAFEVVPSAPAGAVRTIAALTGPGTQDVSPSFASQNASSLFFADDSVGGAARVRWMKIAWP